MANLNFNISQIKIIFTLIISNLLVVFPYLLLGVLLSSSLLVFVNEEKIRNLFPRKFGASVFTGIGLAFLPIVQYANVPVARRLMLQGATVGGAISFLLAAPNINIIALWLTIQAFVGQPQIVLFRLLYGLIVALLIGYIFTFNKAKQPLISQKNYLLKPRADLLISGTLALRKKEFIEETNQAAQFNYLEVDCATEKLAWSRKVYLFLENSLQELIYFSIFLLASSVLLAIASLFIPLSQLLSTIYQPIWGLLIAIFLGIFSGINSLASIFLIANFSTTVTKGFILAFLAASATINLTSLSLYLSVFRPKFVFYIFILSFQLIFLLSLFIDFNIS